MNSDETWLLYLWSGTIGSFVAALIGGLVALWVVRLTNGQQRRIAEDAREVEAIADVISVAESLALVTGSTNFDTTNRFLQFRSALIRLRLSSKDAEALWDGAKNWPYMLCELADLASGDTDGAFDATVSMNVAVQRFSQLLMKWKSEGKEKRPQILAELADATNLLGKSVAGQVNQTTSRDGRDG